jgi:hypothetical protein
VPQLRRLLVTLGLVPGAGRIHRFEFRQNRLMTVPIAFEHFGVVSTARTLAPPSSSSATLSRHLRLRKGTVRAWQPHQQSSAIGVHRRVEGGQLIAERDLVAVLFDQLCKAGVVPRDAALEDSVGIFEASKNPPRIRQGVDPTIARTVGRRPFNSRLDVDCQLSRNPVTCES